MTPIETIEGFLALAIIAGMIALFLIALVEDEE
jgi:hypothetical protein